MRDGKRGANHNEADSLQELLQNTKFEGTADRDFIGQGISPDKKQQSGR